MGPAVPFPSGPPPERTYRAARASVPTAKPRARRSRDAVMWPKMPGASSSFRLDLVRFVLLRAPAAAFGLRGGLRAALQPSHVRTMPPASISSAAPPFWSSNRATSPADLLALRGALGGFLLAFLGRPTTAGGGSSKSSSIPFSKGRSADDARRAVAYSVGILTRRDSLFGSCVSARRIELAQISQASLMVQRPLCASVRPVQALVASCFENVTRCARFSSLLQATHLLERPSPDTFWANPARRRPDSAADRVRTPPPDLCRAWAAVYRAV